MIVVDAHQDIAWNALSYHRDYRISALKHRQREAGTAYPPATMGLPDALLGRTAIVFSTIFAESAVTPFPTPAPNPFKPYETARQAYDIGMTQLDYYHRLADEEGRIKLIETAADLDSVLATWADDTPMEQHQQGLVVLMEGADPIIEPQQFEEWYERGVRVVGLAWSQTRYSAGTGKPGGLTREGMELLEVMASFGAVLDVSHMAEEAYYQALDRYEGQIIASHSNPRRFLPKDRNLSDDMIRKMAERDGVIGVVLYNRFIQQGWQIGDDPITIQHVADIIDHICQITGSAAHVGIGSDVDGGFGSNMIPLEIETTGDLYLIADPLRERGYSDQDIEQIMAGNFLRILRTALP